jgi:hypothetical protein
MPLLLVFAPFDSTTALYWHLSLFVQIIVALNLVVNACYFGAPASAVPAGGRVFRWVFTFVSTALPICYYIDFLVYNAGAPEDRKSKTPALPVALVALLDFTWFGCFPCLPRFLPRVPTIAVRYTLDEGAIGDGVSADELGASANAASADTGLTAVPASVSQVEVVTASV